jgi:peptidylprolyl isomerase
MNRILLFGIIVLMSCNAPTDGYVHLDSGVKRKLLGFGDGSDQMSEAVYAVIGIKLTPAGLDYFHYDSDMEFDPAEYDWDTNRLMISELGGMCSGDSIEWIVPYREIKGLFCDEYVIDEVDISDTASMRLVVSTRVVYTEANYLKSPERAEKMRQLEEIQFIEQEIYVLGLRDSLKWKNGIYERVLKQGDGKRLSYGDELTLGFEGYFLNNELFDSAVDSATFMYFPYGKSDQVIRGLEIALSGMGVGDEKEVWIPSHLAFGVKGSGHNIVPPSTPVKYTLQIVDVLTADSANALREAAQEIP